MPGGGSVLLSATGSVLLSIDSLDGVYVGTVDLSISMGLAGLGDLNDPRLENALNTIVKQVVKHKRIAGIHASTPENAAKLSEKGFHLITPANDTKLLRSTAKNVLEEVCKRMG